MCCCPTACLDHTCLSSLSLSLSLSLNVQFSTSHQGTKEPRRSWGLGGCDTTFPTPALARVAQTEPSPLARRIILPRACNAAPVPLATSFLAPPTPPASTPRGVVGSIILRFVATLALVQQPASYATLPRTEAVAVCRGFGRWLRAHYFGHHGSPRRSPRVAGHCSGRQERLQFFLSNQDAGAAPRVLPKFSGAW